MTPLALTVAPSVTPRVPAPNCLPPTCIPVNVLDLCRNPEGKREHWYHVTMRTSVTIGAVVTMRPLVNIGAVVTIRAFSDHRSL